MNSLEMTEDEYWNWTIDEYQKHLSVGKLREKYINEDGELDTIGFEMLGKNLIDNANVNYYID